MDLPTPRARGAQPDRVDRRASPRHRRRSRRLRPAARLLQLERGLHPRARIGAGHTAPDVVVADGGQIRLVERTDQRGLEPRAGVELERELLRPPHSELDLALDPSEGARPQEGSVLEPDGGPALGERSRGLERRRRLDGARRRWGDDQRCPRAARATLEPCPDEGSRQARPGSSATARCGLCSSPTDSALRAGRLRPGGRWAARGSGTAGYRPKTGLDERCVAARTGAGARRARLRAGRDADGGPGGREHGR